MKWQNMPHGNHKSHPKLDSKPYENYISKFHVVSALSLGIFFSSAKLTDATTCKRHGW